MINYDCYKPLNNPNFPYVEDYMNERYNFSKWKAFIDDIYDNKIPGYDNTNFCGRIDPYANYNSIKSLSKRINVSNEIKQNFIIYFQNVLKEHGIADIYNMSNIQISSVLSDICIDIGAYSLRTKIEFLIFLSNSFYLKNNLSCLIKSSDFSYNPLTKEYSIAGFSLSKLLNYNMFTELEKNEIIAILNKDKNSRYLKNYTKFLPEHPVRNFFVKDTSTFRKDFLITCNIKRKLIYKPNKYKDSDPYKLDIDYLDRLIKANYDRYLKMYEYVKTIPQYFDGDYSDFVKHTRTRKPNLYDIEIYYSKKDNMIFTDCNTKALVHEKYIIPKLKDIEDLIIQIQDYTEKIKFKSTERTEYVEKSDDAELVRQIIRRMKDEANRITK